MRHSNRAIAATVALTILSSSSLVLQLPPLVSTIIAISLIASLGHVWGSVLLVGHDVARLARIAVVVGLALAAPVLGGLALQAAGVPLHRTAWTGLFVGLTLVGDVVLVLQNMSGERLYEDEATSTDVPHKRRFPRWQVLTYALAIIVAVAAVGLADVGATVQRQQGFTELWLTSRGVYTTSANLGISNHQGGVEAYRLVLLRGKRTTEVWNLTLSNSQTWQRTVTIKTGEVTTANLYLVPDLEHPYRHVQTASY